jgi:hypothetical protein
MSSTCSLYRMTARLRHVKVLVNAAKGDWQQEAAE